MSMGSLPGAALSNYPDFQEAKTIVTKVLAEFGPQRYSRLLMTTGVPEDLLQETLKLLENEKTISAKTINEPIDEDDPIYELARSARFGKWW